MHGAGCVSCTLFGIQNRHVVAKTRADCTNLKLVRSSRNIFLKDPYHSGIFMCSSHTFFLRTYSIFIVQSLLNSSHQIIKILYSESVPFLLSKNLTFFFINRDNNHSSLLKKNFINPKLSTYPHRSIIFLLLSFILRKKKTRHVCKDASVQDIMRSYHHMFQ